MVTKKKERYKTIKLALDVTESFDSLEELDEMIDDCASFKKLFRYVYKNREKSIENKKKLKQLIEKYEKQLNMQMKLFLLTILPHALWKRELEKPLDELEQALLMELIPETTSHYIWKEIEFIVTTHVQRMLNKECRTCGKQKIDRTCSTCKKVYFCSPKCQKASMESKTYGHYGLECNIILSST